MLVLDKTGIYFLQVRMRIFLYIFDHLINIVIDHEAFCLFLTTELLKIQVFMNVSM